MSRRMALSLVQKLVSTSSSLRDIARELGLSHTTVAESLRDNPRVKLATRLRVQATAKAFGYQRNTLAGALMSGMRRKRGGAFQGVVAIVDLDGTENRPLASACYHRELIDGASDRAAELGFKADLIVLNADAIDVHDNSPRQRFDSILRERGISGVFLLPVNDHSIIETFDWSSWATVYTDYNIEQTALHNICPNHHDAMHMALQRLHDLGYHCPGLVLEETEDTRLHHRWRDAFRSFHFRDDNSLGTPLPVLAKTDKAGFATWFRAHNPDVVIGHDVEIMNWMRACGAKLPDTHGFCCLNTTKNPDHACAGLDQQPRLLGARGMEQVVGQIYRNEYGAPQQPSTTTIPALWVDGPTLRTVILTPNT